jgi:hypothetical protein
MTPEERFIAIATKKSTKAKQSSLIHQWLGFPCSQSASIRLGNYIEEFINQSVGDRNIKSAILDDGETITADGQVHQVDHLIQSENGDIYHLEAKCNLDLDRGKKRDVVTRDAIITKELTKVIGTDVKCAVFCPLMEESKTTTDLGYIMGMREFVSLFRPDFTLTEFNQLGKSPAIHSVL